jgi:hypothetical protein
MGQPKRNINITIIPSLTQCLSLYFIVEASASIDVLPYSENRLDASTGIRQKYMIYPCALVILIYAHFQHETGYKQADADRLEGRS